MKKRMIALAMALVMVLCLVPTVAMADSVSGWTSFRNSDTNMGITNAETPKSAQETELKWANKLGTDWNTAPSAPIIVDNFMYVMSGSKLYKLNLSDGSIAASADMVAAPSWGLMPPTYADDKIFCPLDGGKVQAFNADTLASEWTYVDNLQGQSLSPITYSEGYLYTGFWNGEDKDANYVCLDANNGTRKWYHTQKGGYYWAGSVVVGNVVLVGCDDGNKGATGTSYLYAFKKGGEGDVTVCDVATLTDMGDQRSSIAFCEDNKTAYFTTAGGYLCSVVTTNTDLSSGTDVFATFTNVKAANASSSTPVVYGDKVYYGALDANGKGCFIMADADTLETISSVPMLAYPQCSALLSTAYESSEGALYFYCTYNYKPGGISLIKAIGESLTCEELYDAAGMEEYCISSVICDAQGTLYYKNDSGNIIAVDKKTCQHTGTWKITKPADCTTSGLRTMSCTTCGRTITQSIPALGHDLYKSGTIWRCTRCDLQEATAANVWVTISVEGDLKLMQKKVIVTDLNESGTVDVDDVLRATHKLYAPHGGEDYSSYTGAYGLSLSELWGNTSGAFGYFLNNVSCWSLADSVADGSYLTAFVYVDKNYWSDSFAKFASPELSDKNCLVGSTCTVRLEKAGYDDNWNQVFVDFTDAELKAYDQNGNIVADALPQKNLGNGSYEVTFKNTGTYYLVATSNSTVPAVCKVTVTGYHGYDTTGAQTVTTDLTAGSITKVTVDGKVVDSKNYTISGSNVTFTAAYLKTLANGKHAVAIENATHVAKATITVENGTTAVNSAKTGDMGVVIYFAMGAMSYIGSAAWIRKRKDEM